MSFQPHGALRCIGSTPMVALSALAFSQGVQAQILGKLESWNPGGSAKDRVALAMVQTALERGQLSPGGTIVEATSGNTGIGLAMVAVPLGIRVIIVMPDSMPMERKALITGYGGEVILTPGAEGMAGAVTRAQDLAANLPGAYLPNQFSNPANVLAHTLGTGPEIWHDTQGSIDVLVAGVGTGGTITGVGHALKARNPAVEIVGVEPAASPLLSEGKTGPHGLFGIGPNFLPPILDQHIIDRVIPVWETDAVETVRLTARTEGFLVGISSGAALFAAITLGKRPEYQGKTIVAILPDGGQRYLSQFLPL